MSEKKKPKTFFECSTGSDLLDEVVGGGVTKGSPAGNIINIVGDKSTGKCIRNSYILTGSGFELIDDIGKEMFYGSSKWERELILKRNEYVMASYFYKEKVKETIKIRTVHGFEETGTLDHKIMIFDKNCNFIMKKLSDLNEKDICVMCRGTRKYSGNYQNLDFKYIKNKRDYSSKNIIIPIQLRENLALIMGYFVADGNFSKNKINYNNTKDWFDRNLSKIVISLFGIELNVDGNISSVEIYNFFQYLFDYPEKFTARNKYIPKKIMQSPKSVQMAFLKGLIDCDSWMQKTSGVGNINYYTASEKLSKQVQLLLLNMGIIGSRRLQFGARIGNKFYDHTYYSVLIGGKDLIQYSRWIGSDKYDLTEIRHMKSKEKNCDFDSIPYLIDRMKKDVKLIRDKMGWSKNGKIKKRINGIDRFPRFLFAGKINITYSLLEEFIFKFTPFREYFDISFYQNLLNYNYHYDFIEEIEVRNKEVDVFDVNIPGDHLFWANGFINHNTFLACEIIAAAKNMYGEKLRWRYDDAESGFTFNTVELYGFGIMPRDEKDRFKSQTVEEFYCNYRTFVEGLKRGELGIYVMDTLDGLSSQEQQKRGNKRYSAYKKGKEFDEGSYQLNKPKFLSQEFFPDASDWTEEKNVLLIIISQTRDKINSIFKEQTRAGGKALDFYGHTALWLSVVSKIKRKDRVVGVVIKAKAKKSKTPRPFRECVFPLLFDYGVDNLGANVDYLFDLRDENYGLLKKAQSIVWEGKDRTRSNLKEFLEKSNKLALYKKEMNSVFKKDELLEWIGEQKDLRADFEKVFGKSRTREELIAWIGTEQKEDELTKRVLEKWEAVESEIRTQRKSKYSKH